MRQRQIIYCILGNRKLLEGDFSHLFYRKGIRYCVEGLKTAYYSFRPYEWGKWADIIYKASSRILSSTGQHKGWPAFSVSWFFGTSQRLTLMTALSHQEKHKLCSVHRIFWRRDLCSTFNNLCWKVFEWNILISQYLFCLLSAHPQLGTWPVMGMCPD